MLENRRLVLSHRIYISLAGDAIQKGMNIVVPQVLFESLVFVIDHITNFFQGIHVFVKSQGFVWFKENDSWE